MLLYLLIAIPALVVVMGLWARSGPVTATDVHCASVDRWLDHQAELIRDGAATQAAWAPVRRSISRVAPRPLGGSGRRAAGRLICLASPEQTPLR